MVSDPESERIMKVAVIVPTLNAGALWPRWLEALKSQESWSGSCLVMDSSSSDATASLALASGIKVHTIKRADFNHGGTRKLAIDFVPDAEVLVFLTQDALLAGPTAISELVQCFTDPKVGAAYGRQLPHENALPIGAHARYFNYPEKSTTKSFSNRDSLGIKTAFISNSFAAYRRAALTSVGGFPSDVIFGEDTYAAAKMLIEGWSVAYCATASVYHSHDYSIIEDFRRSFDIGVFHARESWLLQTFGKAEKEGARFVSSELRYLSKHAPWLIASSMVRTAVKLLGYRLGKLEAQLPLAVKRRCSMSKNYWRTT